MSTQILALHSAATYPEMMYPSLNIVAGGPINGEARREVDSYLGDIKTAMDFATAKHLAVLTMAADRNGAYLVVAPHPTIYALFGDECGQWRRHTENGLTTEHWLGCIGHIRVFWREVKCASH